MAAFPLPLSAFSCQLSSFILARMRMGDFSLKMIPVIAAGVLLLGCAEGPVEYTADNPGGILHQISTDPSEIFRNKVDHEAELEARGVEPPVGSSSWREYWTKLIAYFSGTDAGVGTHQQVTAYIVQQRRVRGLPSL